jgi:hypothetical protein
MKYLPTACALALAVASSADQAQARGGGSFKGATAGTTRPVSNSDARDHRTGYFRSGGVRVYRTCKTSSRCH